MYSIASIAYLCPKDDTCQLLRKPKSIGFREHKLWHSSTLELNVYSRCPAKNSSINGEPGTLRIWIQVIVPALLVSRF